MCTTFMPHRASLPTSKHLSTFNLCVIGPYECLLDQYLIILFNAALHVVVTIRTRKPRIEAGLTERGEMSRQGTTMNRCGLAIERHSVNIWSMHDSRNYCYL